MKKSTSTYISHNEIKELKHKLEGYIHRELSKEEIEAFKEIINSPHIKRLESSSPKLFKPMIESLKLLEETMANWMSARQPSNNADWTFAFWTFVF